MLQALHHFTRTPRRLVQGGLGLLFTGGASLLAAAFAQAAPEAQAAELLAERFPDWPTWWVPEGPAGYTAASMLVCWGVWALGAGLRQARGDFDRR